MCGRYGASWGVDELVEQFDLDSVDVPPAQRLAADWNIAPTKAVYAVLTRRDRGLPAAAPTRRLVTLRWGLVPFWAKDPSVGARMINARIETAPAKAAFREAYAKRRCLLPADGWFEWYTPRATGCGPVKAGRQPFFIRAAGGTTLAFAGLYEAWRDPTREREDPAAWLRTATVLTAAAGPSLAHIHHRQPLLVEPADYSAWLDPDTTDSAPPAGLLRTEPTGGFAAHPVSTAVNNHRNNGPELIEPLPAAQSQALF